MTHQSIKLFLYKNFQNELVRVTSYADIICLTKIKRCLNWPILIVGYVPISIKKRFTYLVAYYISLRVQFLQQLNILLICYNYFNLWVKAVHYYLKSIVNYISCSLTNNQSLCNNVLLTEKYIKSLQFCKCFTKLICKAYIENQTMQKVLRKFETLFSDMDLLPLKY